MMYQLNSALVLSLLLASMCPALPANDGTSPSASGAEPHTPVKPFAPSVNKVISFDTFDRNPIKVSQAAAPLGFKLAVKGDTNADTQHAASVAAQYLHDELGIPANTIKIKDVSRSSTTGITHVYAVQTIDGKEIANSVANINIDKSGGIISASSTFIKAKGEEDAQSSSDAKLELGAIPSDQEQQEYGSSSGAEQIAAASAYQSEGVPAQKRADSLSTRASNQNESIKKAVKAFASTVKAPISDSDLDKATFIDTKDPAGNDVVEVGGLPGGFVQGGKLTADDSYLQLGDGSVAPVWNIVADQGHSYWNAHVNKDTDKVEALANWVSRAGAAYNVYPWVFDSPNDGSQQVVVNPEDSNASPSGWIKDDASYGNNVYARYHPGSNSDRGSRTASLNAYTQGDNKTKAFNYPIDLSQQPQSYVDGSVTQLFYTINVIHDIVWHYGFNEASGNFQNDNFGRGGLGNDAITANAQDGSGINNADFMTPPDGHAPRMRMFLWDQTNPARDGDLEFNIITHEFTHGISNRLTGGPSNANCLASGEAAGMGEGYSDFVSIILRLKPGQSRNDDFKVGAYVYNQNLRRYPYSTDKQRNPTSYGYLDRSDYGEEHYMGELYCEMLYEVLWNLLDAHGISDNLYTHDLSKGNALALQLIIDSFKIQPCNPTFIDSRNAFLQADVQLTGGRNSCLIWKGFAKRGLGVGAKGGNHERHAESFKVPSGC